MADLTEMYRFAAQSIPGYGDFAKGAAASQELMNNQLAYQKAREDLEAQRGLRALFQQNPNAGYSDVAQYSPALAQEMMKNQFATSKDLLEMQKTKSEIEEKQYKLNAEQEKELGHAHGAVVEAYDQLVSQGINPQQAATMVAPLAGQLTAQLAQRGIQTSKTFDPTSINPDVIENMRFNARKHQFPLTQDKMYQSQMESYGRGLGGAQAPVPAGVESTPYGYKVRPGLSSGMAGGPAQTGAPQPTSGIPAPSIEFEGKTYSGPAFVKAFMAETDPARRAKMNEYIDASMASQSAGIPGSQFITPQQESQLRMEEERQKKELETAAAGQKRGAELGAESAEETAKKAATMAVLPPDEEVYGLIKKSLAGQIEKGIKGSAASEQFGIGTEANTATAELISIQEQLRGVVKALYTPGAITEDEQKKMQAAIGAIAEAKDPDSRIAGYRRFMDMARKSIVNHPELASEVERITGSKVLSPRRKLSIGDTVGTGPGAMRYKGGNPNSPDSWEGVR